MNNIRSPAPKGAFILEKKLKMKEGREKWED